MANKFEAAMNDTHIYVDNYYVNGVKQKRYSDAESYLYKGTGHMVGVADWEPQRTNNFEVVIEGLDTLVRAGSWNSSNANVYGTITSGHMGSESGEIADRFYPRLQNAAERLMLSVDSFTAPSLEIAQITTHYGNNSIKWAGKPEFPNSSLTINDYIGIGTEQIMAEWFRAAYNFENECVGLASDYKKTGYLIEYDPSGGQARVWRLDGCWLASFDLGEWSQEGNNQRKMKATLVYDRIIPDYVDPNLDIGRKSEGDTYGVTGYHATSTATRTVLTQQQLALQRWGNTRSATTTTAATTTTTDSSSDG